MVHRKVGYELHFIDNNEKDIIGAEHGFARITSKIIRVNLCVSVSSVFCVAAVILFHARCGKRKGKNNSELDELFIRSF